LLLASGIFGLLVGSFLNVVAFRVPVMMEMSWREQLSELEAQPFTPPPQAKGKSFNLLWPPSACPSCGTAISPLHNIPVLSYLWLRGRCANCQEAVSARYPIVEATVGVLSLIVAWRFGPSAATIAVLGFTWTLVALSLIDLDHKLLPDSMTMPLLWAGLLLSLFEFGGEPLFADLRNSVIGAAAGYLSLWSVFQIFKLLTGKEGMGYGDFKLLAALGAWLGWQLLPLVILLSAGVGAVVGIALIVFRGKSRQTAIPFGPYLAAAGWIAMLWGQSLMDWYLELM
jgi:leader peptidase (prepilin peptidase)/N-methyltransferase